MKTNRRHFIRSSGILGFSAGLKSGFWPAFTGMQPKQIAVDSCGEKISGDLPRASPESQGVSSSQIRQFITAARTSGLSWHSFMLVRHGHVVAEGWWKPYEPTFTHSLFSLSKSFTGTAIGLLVREKKLDLDLPVYTFFQNELPSEVSENLRKMKIRHLLTMTTGIEEDTLPKFFLSVQTWTRTFLEQPVKFEPGTHFTYNSGATYMLSAIVSKITGGSLEKYLESRLFQPLGIRKHDWELSPQGIDMGGFGLRLKTEDIAKFGQLYLQNGKWNGAEVLSPDWVTNATQAQVVSQSDNGIDWCQGYGFQFWRSRHNCYRGDGYYGQYCIVMPETDAVLVFTSEIPAMQRALDLIWDHLLPGLKPDALPENQSESKLLKIELAALTLPVTRGSLRSPYSEKYNGKSIILKRNAFGLIQLRLKYSDSSCELFIKTVEREMCLRFGWERWILNQGDQPYPFSEPGVYPFKVPSRVAGSATWLTDTSMQLDIRRVETMQGDKIVFKFSDNDLTVSFLNSIAEKSNGADAPEKRPPLTGQLS